MRFDAHNFLGFIKASINMFNFLHLLFSIKKIQSQVFNFHIQSSEKVIFYLSENYGQITNLLAYLTIFLGHLHLFDLQIREYQN
jgi:hypothetical protein